MRDVVFQVAVIRELTLMPDCVVGDYYEFSQTLQTNGEAEKRDRIITKMSVTGSTQSGDAERDLRTGEFGFSPKRMPFS